MITQIEAPQGVASQATVVRGPAIADLPRLVLLMAAEVPIQKGPIQQAKQLVSDEETEV